MRQSYNYEVIKKIQLVVRNSLDPERDPDPDLDSMNMDPKHWFLPFDHNWCILAYPIEYLFCSGENAG